MLINIPAFASSDVTLKCSYITQNSDLHIQLNPFTITTKGKVIRDKSIIGNATFFEDKQDTLHILLDNGASIIFDLEKALSIYTIRVEGESVYSYGSCMKVK